MSTDEDIKTKLVVIIILGILVVTVFILVVLVNEKSEENSNSLVCEKAGGKYSSDVKSCSGSGVLTPN
jgi:hypothetical protein